MPANRPFVAFPLILAWRQEFWSLPLYFPDLKVGVLWQWPSGIPYQGRPLPPDAAGGGREISHYAPGELKQRQAYEEYTSSREEVSDIVRALRGEPPEPPPAEEPWQDQDPLSLAWQLEVMEADQEAHLAQVDLGDEWLGQILTPEMGEESPSLTVPPEDIEVLDPETARLRYLLWRREMAESLGPRSVPLLLGRTSLTIFLSLRREGGGGGAPRARVRLPGCRTEEEYRAAQTAAAAADWQGEFQARLEACLQAARAGEELEPSTRALNQWLAQDLPRLWPGLPSWTWELEIWATEPGIQEAGEALLAWAGLGRSVVPG